MHTFKHQLIPAHTKHSS